MQRTKYNHKGNVTAICTADWHLREDTPLCWVGDFQKVQWESVEFVSMLQKQYNCPVYLAGDLFDYWKPSPWLISKALEYLPDRMYSVAGNHDLPQHSWDLLDKSGIFTMRQANRLTLCDEANWNQEPEVGSFKFRDKLVLLWHVMVYRGVSPFPGCDGSMSGKILRKYPQFDLIVTGDNHKAFTDEFEGRVLINPGSLTRQTADQYEFKPRVYLWYAESNTVEPVFLPWAQEDVNREYLEVEAQRNERLGAFVSGLNDDWAAGMSFDANLKAFEATNNVRKSTMELIYKAKETIIK